MDLHGLACCGAVGAPANDKGDRVGGDLATKASGGVFDADEAVREVEQRFKEMVGQKYTGAKVEF